MNMYYLKLEKWVSLSFGIIFMLLAIRFFRFNTMLAIGNAVVSIAWLRYGVKTIKLIRKVEERELDE